MSWRSALPLDEIPVGHTRMIRIDDEQVALCRLAEREVYAIEDVCSHDGAPLGGNELVGAVLECPRHGARFDVRDGRVLRMPAVASLATFPIRISDDDVVEIDWEDG